VEPVIENRSKTDHLRLAIQAGGFINRDTDLRTAAAYLMSPVTTPYKMIPLMKTRSYAIKDDHP